MKALAMECFKCRRRRLWLPLGIMLAVQLAYLFYTMRDMTAKELSQGWAMLFYYLPYLNAMLVPVFAAILASRMADIEHKGQTLKLLETIQTPTALLDAKILCGAGYFTLTLTLQILAAVGFGILRGFAGDIPLSRIAEYCIATWLVTIGIFLFQLVLSLLIPNQMIGMISGLAGAFVGLFSLFFPPSFQKFLLWAYYAVLYNTRMDWDRATRISDYYFCDFDLSGLLCLALYILAIYLIGRVSFAKKEV